MPEYSKKLFFTVIITLIIVCVFLYFMYLYLSQIQIARSTEATSITDISVSEEIQGSADAFYTDSSLPG